MKTLLILRHGAAERTSPSGDWGRRLTLQGTVDADRAGRRIKEAFGVPQVIVSSDALRAQQTAERVAAVLGFAGTPLVNKEIYQADTVMLLNVIHSLPDEAALALLVGHNPGLEHFSSLPLGTASLAALQWDTEYWAEVLPQTKTTLPFPN